MIFYKGGIREVASEYHDSMIASGMMPLKEPRMPLSDDAGGKRIPVADAEKRDVIFQQRGNPFFCAETPREVVHGHEM
jgi:hypothetical protein